MENLGIDINTQLLVVINPLPKREDYITYIDTVWLADLLLTQRGITTLLGHARTASMTRPFGL